MARARADTGARGSAAWLSGTPDTAKQRDESNDANRDALARVVAELSLSYEEHEEAYQSGRPYERYYDLRFGEPGWFDVTREESG